MVQPAPTLFNKDTTGVAFSSGWKTCRLQRLLFVHALIRAPWPLAPFNRRQRCVRSSVPVLQQLVWALSRPHRAQLALWFQLFTKWYRMTSSKTLACPAIHNKIRTTSLHQVPTSAVRAMFARGRSCRAVTIARDFVHKHV